MAAINPDLRYLDTTDGHRLCYAEFGNPGGVAVLYLHGGPGSDCNEAWASLFNLDHFRLIMMDQRGCGGSKPAGRIIENNTQALIADNERLRKHLGIAHWWVYGGSWGATLALEYGKKHPQSLLGLVLRGSFLARTEDLQWFIASDGVAQHFPDAYQALRKQLAQSDAPDKPLTTCLYERLLQPLDDFASAYQAAHAWECWEATVMRVPLPAFSRDENRQRRLVASKRIYAHYCHHGFFLPEQGVLPGIEHLGEKPLILVHGRQDQVCRLHALQPLCEALPQTELHVVEAGHGIHEAAIQQKLWEIFVGLVS